MAVLGLRFCARVFSSCGKRRPLFIAVRGPLTIAASPVAEHRLQTRRLSNCGSRVQPLRGTWDLPRPELEPLSPALAGRFSTTAPPGKPWMFFLIHDPPLTHLRWAIQSTFSLWTRKILKPTSWWYMASQFFVKHPQPASSLSLRNKNLNLKVLFWIYFCALLVTLSFNSVAAN